jgi:hypothetical protein
MPLLAIPSFRYTPEKWQPWPGMGGNHPPEWVATLARNGGNFAPEYSLYLFIETFCLFPI